MLEKKEMKKKNIGFSVVEILIVVAVIAILSGALAPFVVKYIQKSRRSKDVTAATEIKNAFDRALVDSETCELTVNLDNASSVTIDSTYIYTTPPTNLVDAAISELGLVPVPSINEDYAWNIVLDPTDYHVNVIYLIDPTDTSVKYEVYPNDTAFLEMSN